MADPLAQWKTALSNRATAPVNILCLGDSITEGIANTLYTNRWTNLLHAQLKSYYGATGSATGWAPPGHTAPNTTFPNEWTPSSGVSLINLTWGLSGYGATMHSSGPDTLTRVVTGTSIDLVYVSASNLGQLTVTVDGVLAATINTYSAVTNPAAKTRVPLGAHGPHTVVITATTLSSIVCGIIEYDGDESQGIRLWNGGHGGWKSSDPLSSTNNRRANYAAMYNLINPDLVILAFGRNDQTASVDPSTFQANLAAIIADLNTSVTKPSILLQILYNVSASAASQWSPYADAITALVSADTTGRLSLVDLRGTVPNVLDGGHNSDYDGVIHPYDSGSPAIAAAHYAVLATPVVASAGPTATALTFGLVNGGFSRYAGG